MVSGRHYVALLACICLFDDEPIIGLVRGQRIQTKYDRTAISESLFDPHRVYAREHVLLLTFANFDVSCMARVDLTVLLGIKERGSDRARPTESACG